MSHFLDAALDYSRLGFSVIPIQAREKKPLIAWEEYQARRPAEDKIKAWWAKWPHANVAIVTGAVSGVAVIDVDKAEAVEELKKRFPNYDFKKLPRSRTGRGWQLFFKHPGVPFPNRAGVLPGLDVRGDGGYVVAPPSIHATGKLYRWEVPLTGDLPKLPVELFKFIISPSPNGDNGYRERFNTAQALAGVPEGQRDDTLFRLACKLRAADVPQDMAQRLILEAASNCQPPFPDQPALEKVRNAYSRYEPTQKEVKTSRLAAEPAWARAKDAPSFLGEEEKEFQGFARDLLAPGVVTLIASPRGVGKTQVSHALAVALATGGIFRGEQVQPVRVLLVDRDNPKAIVKSRLRSWGAVRAVNLHVLTRQDAPDLKHKAAWETFPLQDFDVLIIDSVGSATEGITEREGKETTEVLATLLDLARKGLAVLLLTNCTKDALNLKGRGEWADRVDILYEVRDATGFIPSGKKSWWHELPEAGESAWAERAARRKGRIDFRLAFIPSKFRIGAEPEPFCLEIHLPKEAPWTLADVTAEILQAGEEATAQAKTKDEERLEKAAKLLAEVVRDRAARDKPILKTEAETFLHENELPRKQARDLIAGKNHNLWHVEELPGKGRPQALFPASPDCQTCSAAKMHGREQSNFTRGSEGGVSADHAQSGRQKWDTRNPVSEAALPDPLFSPPEGDEGWEEV